MDSKIYEKIDFLIDARRLDDAVKLIKKGLSESPNDDELFAKWGLCEMLKEQYDKAEKLSKKALELNAENYMAKRCLACTYHDSEKYDKSLALIKEMLKENPEDYSLYYLLASCLMVKEKYESAKKAIDKALSFDPNDSDFLVLKARLYRLMNQPRRAEFYSNMALEQAPDESDALIEKGWIAIDENDSQKAKEFFMQAMAVNPTNAYAKEGMKLALKSDHWFYNFFFRFSLFMQGLTQSKKTMIRLGIMAAVTIMQGVATKLFLLGGLVALACLLLVIFSSTIDPLSNLVLAANPYGRQVLRKSDIQEGYVALSLWIAFIFVLLVSLFLDKSVVPAFSVLLLVFPLKRTSERRTKSSFKYFLVVSALMVLASLYFCIGTWLGLDINGLVIFLFIATLLIALSMPLFKSA